MYLIIKLKVDNECFMIVEWNNEQKLIIIRYIDGRNYF